MLILGSFLKECLRSLMDRTQACGACNLGPIPSGDTSKHKKRHSNSGVFCDIITIC